MIQTPINDIADHLNIESKQVEAVAALLEENATVPFIARYRKEATGSLDEVAITFIRDRLAAFAELSSRKEAILKSLHQNGHLTDTLEKSVMAAPTMAELEDIYLPYRPKRRTKATKAKEKGLEPLALEILKQTGVDPNEAAASFIDADKGVESITEALSGARDIIAEIVNEDKNARAALRRLYSVISG